jgi:cytoskeletal protein RodZ
MELVFLCKMLSDLSLYFAFGLYIYAWIGHSPSVFIPFSIMILSAMLSYRLRGSQRQTVRMLPLGLMLLCFLFPKNLIDHLLLVPPCLYTGFVVKRQLFRLDYNTQHDAFMLGLKLLPLLLLPSLFTLDFVQLQQGALPFVLLFLVCGVLLMRMLRHDAVTIEQTRFKLQNTAAVILCIFLGYELSRGSALHALSLALSAAYRMIISPLMMLVAYGLSFFAYLFALFLKLFFRDIEVTKPQSEVPEAFSDTFGTGGTRHLVLPPWLVLLGKILLAAGLLILVFLVFRRFLRRKQSLPPDSTPEMREALAIVNEPIRIPKDLFPPKEPRQAIRYYYRKFLRMYLSLGLPFNRSKTSAEIRDDASLYFETDLLSAFRNLYAKARYHTAEPTPEDAAEAKRLYLALKAQKGSPTAKKAQKTAQKKPRPPKGNGTYR